MGRKKPLVHVRRTKIIGPSLKSTLIRPWYIWSKFPPISVTHPKIAKQWHARLNGVETPDQFTYSSRQPVWWKCPKALDHVWQASVVQRTRSKSPGLGCPFCRGLRPSVTNSLASLYPKLARELHPTKNGKLTAKGVVSGSSKRLWWRCLKDTSHVWLAAASWRTRQSSGCPFCIGRRVTKHNSLLSIIPQAKKYWHPTKNGALRPSEVSFGMSAKIWWQCPKGTDHVWAATIQSFSRSWKAGTTGCPFCAGRRLSATNKLTTVYPEIAGEWHPTKNGKLKPRQLTFTSTRQVWWRCPHDESHLWQGTPYERTQEARTCPYCRGWLVNDSNSLATLRPEVAKQWHATRNGKLTPDMVTEHSSRLVWWQCLKNKKHVFQAKILWQAAINKARCPTCTGRRTMPANSLLAKCPELASQWHHTLNGSLTNRDVAPSHTKHVWWQCPQAEDHVWKQTPHARYNGSGCPFCAGHKASSTRSLALLYPEISQEWHPTKNAPLKPSDVTPGSNRRVWWRCIRKPEHVWQTTILHRVQSNAQCRFCVKERLSQASEKYSLKSEYPEVAKQWHPEKNGTLMPEYVFPKSRKRVWWQCSKNKRHIWEAVVATRTYSGAGCPYCAGKRK